MRRAYDNPADLSAKSQLSIVMQEETEKNGKLERLIRTCSCMHCRSGCLKKLEAGAPFSTLTDCRFLCQPKLHGCGYLLLEIRLIFRASTKKDNRINAVLH